MVTEAGQVLFLRKGHIWSLPHNGGEETFVTEGHFFPSQGCTWRDNIVYIRHKENEGALIESFSLKNSETTPLHSLENGIEIGMGLTVSPDGQWILFTRMEATADLMLVENFR
jgi:hypothetical protein